MIVQGAFNHLFRPGLRRDFRDSFEQYAPEYSQFLKVSRSDMPEQSAITMSGLSRLLERGDGEPLIYEDPKIGPKVMGVDKEFALGFIITRRTVEDDQYKKANQASKWLAKAGRNTMEYRSAALLDDAFTGNFFRGMDNLPLIHTAHTTLGGGTVSNRSATDVALSNAGITGQFDLYQNMKDENGDPMRAFPDTLILGNNAGDYHTALQIFNSDLEPFTANQQNDNAIRRRMPRVNIIVSHYKTNPKSYFMMDSSLNDAHMVIRRPIEFDDTWDFDTDAAKYKATTRFLVWFVDWRGWTGSNPI